MIEPNVNGPVNHATRCQSQIFGRWRRKAISVLKSLRVKDAYVAPYIYKWWIILLLSYFTIVLYKVQVVRSNSLVFNGTKFVLRKIVPCWLSWKKTISATLHNKLRLFSRTFNDNGHRSVNNYLPSFTLSTYTTFIWVKTY